MRIRAVFFDVYGTLLDVGPPPADADAGWRRLWRRRIGRDPRLSRDGFSAACQRVIDREHAAARARGIPFPEVFWPGVVREVLPELAMMDGRRRDEFVFAQAQLWHTVRMPVGAAEVLRRLAERAVPLGIASNAQPYTLRELGVALKRARLPRDPFASSLCFWSFAHGFSKPDPHVFGLLTARLRARGICPAEALMVGDRADNDIAPAQAQGWRTWQLSASERGATGPGGGWGALRRHLETVVGPAP